LYNAKYVEKNGADRKTAGRENEIFFMNLIKSPFFKLDSNDLNNNLMSSSEISVIFSYTIPSLFSTETSLSFLSVLISSVYAWFTLFLFFKDLCSTTLACVENLPDFLQKLILKYRVSKILEAFELLLSRNRMRFYKL